MMTCIKGKCSRIASHKMIQITKCMKKALYGNFESSVDIFETWEILNALKVFLTKTLVSGKLLMVQLMTKLVKVELKRTE